MEVDIIKKIVIIGGGIAGLSAGCYAKMNGYDAHIYEMHTQPGGLCTAWKRKGYTFDTCIHWLTGSSPDSPYYQIWQELGAIQNKKIYLKDMSVKVFLKNKTVNFYNNPDKLEMHLNEIAPQDSGAIKELVECMKSFYRLRKLPITKPKELCNIIDTLKMMKQYSPFMSFIKKYGTITIDEFAGKFTNSVLKQAIQSMTAISPSNAFFNIPFVLATMGFGFPEGGSLDFAKSIEKRFTSLGGKIHYNQKIKRILTENNRAVGIQLEDGKEVNADIVISAADGYSTIFKMLDSKYISKNIEETYKHSPVIPSWLQVSIGLDMDLSKEANIRSIYNFYELDAPVRIADKEIKYLNIKNYAFDPTLSPKGKSTIVAGFSSDYAYWEKIYQDKEKYKQEKNNIQETVVSCLEKIIPGIKNKIETIDVSTPITIYRYTNNWQGSIMGFMKFISLKLPRKLPGLNNFYMAGQWVGDTGLPRASRSGKDIVKLICKKDRKKFVAEIQS